MLYNAFLPKNFQEGKYWVVGDINGLTTELRWREETPVFRDIILDQLSVNSEQLRILDYGCGCGRLIRAILDKKSDIKIVAVDQSENMLGLAKEYNKEHVEKGMAEFLTVPEFDERYGNTKFELGYCVYVLQHVPSWDLRVTIRRIGNACDKLLLVDSLMRMAVPKFEDDQVNVLEEIKRVYTKFGNAIPGQILMDNLTIRIMFLTGGIRHCAFICEK